MVRLGNLILRSSVLIAQSAEGPLIQRLDPQRNVALVMALFAIVLIGITLVACIMIGGHWVRKLARSQPKRKSSPMTNSEAWRAALSDSLATEKLSEGKSSETVFSDGASDDTRVD